MVRNIFLIGFFCSCWLFHLSGQPAPARAFRTKLIKPPVADSLFLDTLVVWPNSVQVSDLSGRFYQSGTDWYINQNYLVWYKTPPSTTLRVSFRVLPYPHSSRFTVIDSTLSTYGPTNKPIVTPIQIARTQEWMGNQNLSYSGSFARGLSFGNRQNLVLNSTFNLQLSGDLGDDFYLLAAITDENIPLQPSGNTQQLNEFDRVFVQITRQQNQLTAGDYELTPGQSYFMRFFKKLQGATYQNTTNTKKGKLSTRGSIAVARGQFVRRTLSTSEGNQGPYRLQGLRGESFIIVLSGTERIYLDGKQLTRGIENDYTINYNLGEITFTANQLITRESRIIVEFEYADQNYLRSLTHLESEYKAEKSRFYIQMFSQQDSKNTTLNLNLTEADRERLTQAGDDPLKAVTSSIMPSETRSPARVFYRLLDTVIQNCGLLDSILVYATSDEEQLFSARFSFVGSGQGNYQLADNSIANEPVFKWVAPDPVTCQPRGDYAPIIQLPTPQQHQMIVAGMEWSPTQQTQVLLETSTSTLDLNRFSNIDQKDDRGYALFSKVTHQLPMSFFGKEGTWETSAAYEFKQAYFQPINPYRPQEYLRDWSLADFNGNGQIEATNEHLLQASLGYQMDSLGGIQYGLARFDRNALYEGTRQHWQLDITTSNTSVNGYASLVRATTPTDNRRFWRPDITIKQQIPFLPGLLASLHYQAEDNRREEADSLSLQSFSFHRWEAGIQNADTTQLTWSLAYQKRKDQLPLATDLTDAIDVESVSAEIRLRPSRFWQLKSRLQYRNLTIRNTNLTSQRPNQTFLGRVQNNLILLKGIIRTSTVYELGSGQEPQVDFTYIKVATGEGQYIWLDSLYNNDGVIQPNEMEIAPFPDQADYVRISRITNAFFKTQNVQFNQSLSIIPRIAWFGEKSNWKAVIAKLSTQSSFRIARKTNENGSSFSINPLKLNIVDSSLVSLSSAMQHTVFFNRGKPIFESQLGITDNRSRIAQTTGFESRQITNFFLRTRTNLNQIWSIQTQWSLGSRFNNSENFENKSYKLEFTKVEPSLSWTPSQRFRGALNARFQTDRDVSRESGDQAMASELESSFTYNRSVKTSLSSQISFIQIKYNGNPSSPVGFAILNGLQSGRNILWSLQLDQQLGKNLRLSLTYEGRKTGNSSTVHVGRAQIAAVF
ncbi:MAG: hypothetical protein HRU40_05055 [Saprospiraceae bacterium]|nr:hypothetical protein [Saprospiraceae bacterium]